MAIERKEYMQQFNKSRYESLKSQGLCVQCGGENDGRFVNCTSCRKDKAEQKRKYKKTVKGQKKTREQAIRRRKRPEYAEWRRNYINGRYASDLQFKLARLLRDRLAQAVRGNWKGGSAVKSLGCTIAELKVYLEERFEPGMTWENHGHGNGRWNIDHIMPLASFDLTNPERVSIVCHYTNLQPLWYEDNVKKGSRASSVRFEACGDLPLGEPEKQEPSAESHDRFW